MRIPATLRKLAVPIDDLQPYKGNARRRKDGGAGIRESLEKNGQYRPVVVWKGENQVLAGNHTYAAARELGWTKIAATYVEVDAEQARRINLVDNADPERHGDYDYEALAELLRSFDGDLEGTGYDADSFRDVLAELDDEPADGATDPDDIPEPADQGPDHTGRIWQLGEHRLICGDATDPAVVGAVMAGDQADLVWTDPPYNVDYTGKTADALKIGNDALAADDFGRLLLDSLRNAADNSRAGAPIYMAHADTERIAFQTALEAAGWEQKQTLVWVKNVFVLGRQDYQWQHEPILYGWKPGAAHSWYGAFDKDTLIDDERPAKEMKKAELVEALEELRAAAAAQRIDRPSRSSDHPTTKPVDLIHRHLQNSSQRGDVVLDTFGGSGSTLIAAEQLARRARLVELDPRYCEVIVRRWEAFTEQEARDGAAD
jgi:DNA modification methylase